MTVTVDQDGKLRGLSHKDQKAYQRFRKKVLGLGQGEILTLDYWFPRNRKLHAKHFVMLAEVFDAQERFTDPDEMRMWLQVGAGHCEFVPGRDGQLVAIPKSIAWKSMDDEHFSVHHEKVKDFLRAPHARAFLWPHLSEEHSWQTVEILLEGFEKKKKPKAAEKAK